MPLECGAKGPAFLGHFFIGSITHPQVLSLCTTPRHRCHCQGLPCYSSSISTKGLGRKVYCWPSFACTEITSSVPLLSIQGRAYARPLQILWQCCCLLQLLKYHLWTVEPSGMVLICLHRDYLKCSLANHTRACTHKPFASPLAELLPSTAPQVLPKDLAISALPAATTAAQITSSTTMERVQIYEQRLNLS